MVALCRIFWSRTHVLLHKVPNGLWRREPRFGPRSSAFREDDLRKATADASGPPSPGPIDVGFHLVEPRGGAITISIPTVEGSSTYVICQNVLVPVNWGIEDSVHLSEYNHPDTYQLVLHTLNKTFKECWLGILGCEDRSAILASCWANFWLLVSTLFT